MGSIAQEKVTYKGKETNYKVKIKSFDVKTKFWNPGRVVHLNTFQHDDVRLTPEIYPNGSTHRDNGYVSFYLENEENEDIEVKFDVHLEPSRMLAFCIDIPKGTKRGKGSWIKHKDLPLSEDGDLVMTLIIKKISKAAPESSHAINRLEDKVESLEYQLKKLSMKLSNSVEGRGKEERTLPKPECPVCFEEMTSTTRIAQCLSGHHLCWNCKEKMSSQGTDTAECPTCMLPVNGRAFGMENYLKTLFS